MMTQIIAYKYVDSPPPLDNRKSDHKRSIQVIFLCSILFDHISYLSLWVFLHITYASVLTVLPVCCSCVVNGVELFFNIPVHRLPTVFTYHVITVSAHYHIVADATQTVQQVECSTDFRGQLRLFLNQGWKLVDICIDSAAIADGMCT